ncbi:toxin HicA [Sansalvadorimonas verongulae]|uniref:toxin HicA n=1 Tax=Sansalvadorimonas verongulae TaxID=2172824 RepID=UPI0012BD599A|nr:toxin HicA [Sansalvadorimonas verongulae]MTI12164.1 toxin HicA [Sansalvadorimonas verongulae]
MSKWQKLLDKLRHNPCDVRFDDLEKICDQYFGSPRQLGSSHRVYKTPWKGDPRINIQKSKNGKAKNYQVSQVLEAINKLEAMNHG